MTPRGDIRDIKHVVILMQENRSFDHYFGSLRGVRGFGDRATILLPGGLPVWRQPGAAPGQPAGGTRYPWPLSAGTFTGAQPPTPQAGAQHYGGTGPTGPNRTYLWSGTINAGQQHGSYVAYGASDDELGRFLPWQSYPETLQAAGVSWKVYQGSDNYGDNGAQYFAAVARVDPAQGGTAAPGDVYYDNGVVIVPEPHDPEFGTADNLALAIRNDVLTGALPQVSWVVTNQRFSEHPAGSPDDGAYFTGQVLRALGVGSHLGHPVHRAVDRRARHAGDLPAHQRLAAQRLRRPDRRLRLRQPRVRAAGPAVRDRSVGRDPGVSPSAGQRRDAGPGARHQAGQAAARPARRQPRRIHRGRRRGHRPAGAQQQRAFRQPGQPRPG